MTHEPGFPEPTPVVDPSADQPSIPTQDPTSDFTQAQLAEMVGFKTGQHFPDRAQEKLASREIDPERLAITAEQLADIGIDIDPAATPQGWGDEKGIADFKLLTDDDKATIKASNSPLLTLWGLTTLRKKEWVATHPALSGVRTEYMRRQSDPAGLDHELAILGSLGLVHGTDLEGLMGALEKGAFVPQREISDDTKGHTLHTDRDPGLDGYVFADYGRPHAYRRAHPPAVEVVFDLTAMNEQGSFATEQDIADLPNVTSYVSTVSEAAYFLEAVQVKLADTVAAVPGTDIIFGPKLTAQQFADGIDGDPSTGNTNGFSTWEVKMPKVETSKIKKIIFRDAAAMATFQERYGDAFPCEFVEPDKKAEYYDKEEIQENDIKLAKARAEAFHESMTARLAELPDDDKEIVFAAVRTRNYETEAIRAEQSVAYGEPQLLAASEDELRAKIRQENGYGQDPNTEGFGLPVRLTDSDDQYMLVKVQRSKRNPSIAIFADESKTAKLA